MSNHFIHSPFFVFTGSTVRKLFELFLTHTGFFGGNRERNYSLFEKIA